MNTEVLLRAFSKRVIALQPLCFTRVAMNFLGIYFLRKEDN
jgi:hypothetical protein